MSQRPVPFGRYLLVELLAEGGMAQVYRAVLREASGFEKQVALKRIRRELSDDADFIARFVDEARIASTLSHSNIAQVFDFGQVDGEHFLAMELVDGPDLGTLMAACRAQRQPIPIPTATFVVAEAARGLGVAHRRAPSPVVHRDVSPQNILLSRAGEVKVVDFGIALAAEKALRTRTGLVLGKCRYMAPEQARGEVLDGRADVFAAACVLFELLAGAPLFDGDTAEQVLKQLVAAPIPPVSSKNPDVPPELDEILARALDRRREVRPADGSVLARELEALLHHMAPDFSAEDLVLLIRAEVPPRRGPAWLAVETVAEADGAALSSTMPDPPLERATPSPAAATLATAETALAPAPSSPPSSWEPPSVLLAAQTTAPLDRPGPLVAASPPAAPAGAARRSTLLLVAACVLGAGAGVATGLASNRPDRMRLAAGATVEHDGWRVRLDERVRRGDALLLRMRVWSETEATPSMVQPRLQLGGRRLAPTVCASGRGEAAGEWRLAFAFDGREGRAPPVLELRPPGAPVWQLVLVADP